jgi:hypothetical protein
VAFESSHSGLPLDATDAGGSCGAPSVSRTPFGGVRSFVPGLPVDDGMSRKAPLASKRPFGGVNALAPASATLCNVARPPLGPPLGVSTSFRVSANPPKRISVRHSFNHDFS